MYVYVENKTPNTPKATLLLYAAKTKCSQQKHNTRKWLLTAKAKSSPKSEKLTAKAKAKRKRESLPAENAAATAEVWVIAESSQPKQNTREKLKNTPEKRKSWGNRLTIKAKLSWKNPICYDRNEKIVPLKSNFFMYVSFACIKNCQFFVFKIIEGILARLSRRKMLDRC